MARTSGGTPEAEGTVPPRGLADTRTGRTIRWIDYRLPIFTAICADLVTYPTPVNLNYWWNFGSLAGIMLVIMIVTGVVLAMHYTANADLAFGSVERIMRDVNYGWLLRYIHTNGASMFFLIVYIHMFRGLVLRLVQISARTVVDPRRRHSAADDGDSVHGLRAALGADELLGRDRHHQPVLGDPARRPVHRDAAVGRFHGRATRR